MIQTVVKRDGRIVGFNEEKIITAIRKAMLHTEKGEDMSLIRQIADHISFRGDAQMTVEAIQDMVELELMKSSRKDVAKKYISYRNQRRIARKAKTRDVFQEIINIQSNDVTRENANMNADTPAGMMMKFASETTKPFVDDFLLSEEVVDAVSNNYLHIHDKDYYPTKSLTCCQHPLDNILINGFNAGHGESRPAKRIETASIMACISLETAQNEMHGGQAIPAFDFYLAPYVRRSYIEELKNMDYGFICTNVQETDLAGHSQDSGWYAKLLQISDEKIAKMLPLLGDEDILLVMADHGNDPNIGHNKHTRENVPLLVYRKGVQGVDLGLRRTLSDVGATVCDFFGVKAPQNGESFLELLK